MASSNHQHYLFPLIPLLITVFRSVVSSNVFIKSAIYPFDCSNHIQTCNSFAYHISRGYSIEKIASFYSVNTSDITPISRDLKQDYIVSVPCSCKDVNGTRGYFYDIIYEVQSGDTFFNVSGEFYSGQAWEVARVEELFVTGDRITIHLVCGCVEVESQEIDSGSKFYRCWMGAICAETEKRISSPQARNRNLVSREEDPKAGSKILSARKTSLQQRLHEQDIEATFESERPVIYSVEEIEEATCNFDDSMKIGEGGYGSVYVGTLKEQEVAIKKMKSSRSKEFISELKVLCKIHHINVVELLGYASSDNHFYLIYEYVQHGSLNEHLHDPLLKGRSPLSWIERVHIAVDAARGIEYIHDHTKARYVHRDIKTSNILLDQGHRAKVADFGLARLVERSNEEDFVATRLVGTPVLAELVTGQRALARDKKEPNKLKSLISVIKTIFRHQDSEAALEADVDPNLSGSYPMEQVYKMAELSENCLSEEAADRPEMREIVQTLSQILMSSIEWEASLSGASQVFTGL
ncbi:hypothetical protein Patl1_18104 [Pistacia atlantica]|uniref:Uncharacterized protein n=1 Tax=Pistacia atlantica TaxID=434234 RepID=A0ACC1C1M8_9ROSI|nr:hypothetical protein Patl1_18104 [Pistacia atlantica]